MRPSRSWPLPALAVLCLTSAHRAEAQETTSRIDVTGSVVTTFFDAFPTPRRGIGASFSVDVALSRRLSLTTQAIAFPREELSEFQAQGGRTAEFTAGLRGALVEGHRWALESRVSGGIIHFTRVFTTVASTTPDIPTGSANHFDLDLGLALRYRLSRHLDVVIESSTVAYPVSGESQILSQSEHSSVRYVFPASIRVFPQISGGARYRLGARPLASEKQVEAHRWTVGAELSSSIEPTAGYISVLDHLVGPGMFATFRLDKYLDIDGDLVTTGHSVAGGSAFEGGRVTEGLAGVRIGVRTARGGLFLKVRAGAVSNSRTLHSVSTAPPISAGFRRLTAPATDVGCVVEVYATHRLTARLDAGLAQTYFSDQSVVIDGTAITDPVVNRSPTMRISTGLGWRF
jgi:hypothetical protein